MRKSYLSALLLAGVLVFVGCGDSSDNSNGVKPSGDEITQRCQTKTRELDKFKLNKDKWTPQDYSSYETFFIANSNNENIYCKAGLGILYMIQNKTNYDTIYSLIEPAAQAGFASAQNNLGNLYLNGHGVEKDYQKANEWYTKAANQGDAGGQINLGVSYYKGQGVEKDYQKGYEWYTKAANQGDAVAQYNLSVSYYNGQGVEKDYQKAYEWATKSANQGYASGQNSLGVLYYYGKGVTKNTSKSCEWFAKAKAQDHELGEKNYNKLCK